MESIGYKSTNVSNYDKIEKTLINKGEIEILCGNIASGKTYSMINYLNKNKNCLYVSSLKSKNLPNILNDNVSIYNPSNINSLLNNDEEFSNNVIVDSIETIDKSEKKDILKSIIKYCNKHNKELLIDVDCFIVENNRLIKDIKIPCHITCLTSKNNNILESVLNDNNNLKLTYTNYKH